MAPVSGSLEIKLLVRKSVGSNPTVVTKPNIFLALFLLRLEDLNTAECLRRKPIFCPFLPLHSLLRVTEAIGLG